MGVSVENVAAAYPVAMLFHVHVGSYPYAKRQAYLLP